MATIHLTSGGAYKAEAVDMSEQGRRTVRIECAGTPELEERAWRQLRQILLEAEKAQDGKEPT